MKVIKYALFSLMGMLIINSAHAEPVNYFV